MNADGSNPIRITNDPAADTHPRWSPDGTMLLFRSVRAVIGAPYIYHFATGETVPVTPDTFPLPIDAGGLNWLPDGRHLIADQLDPQQLPTNRKIVIIDRLTGSVRELTPDTTFDDHFADVRPFRGN